MRNHARALERKPRQDTLRFRVGAERGASTLVLPGHDPLYSPAGKRDRHRAATGDGP